MPIGVLIGALLGLGTLARGSELTVMRAAGVSVWRIAGSVDHGRRAARWSSRWCAASSSRRPCRTMAKRQKALSKFSNISFANRGGAWVRDGNLLINVMQQSGSAEFGGMRIFELTPDHQLVSVATREHRAACSRTAAGSCRVTRSRASAARTSRPTTRRAASSSPRSAATSSRLTVAQPRQLETRVLWKLMQAPEGQRPRRHARRSSPSGRASRAPPPSCSPRLLAVPFVFGSLRVGRIGRTPADRRADRRFVLLRAAPARERHAWCSTPAPSCWPGFRRALLRGSRAAR